MYNFLIKNVFCSRGRGGNALCSLEISITACIKKVFQCLIILSIREDAIILLTAYHSDNTVFMK